jgi:hypothetical protein
MDTKSNIPRKISSNEEKFPVLNFIGVLSCFRSLNLKFLWNIYMDSNLQKLLLRTYQSIKLATLLFVLYLAFISSLFFSV